MRSSIVLLLCGLLLALGVGYSVYLAAMELRSRRILRGAARLCAQALDARVEPEDRAPGRIYAPWRVRGGAPRPWQLRWRRLGGRDGFDVLADTPGFRSGLNDSWLYELEVRVAISPTLSENLDEPALLRPRLRLLQDRAALDRLMAHPAPRRLRAHGGWLTWSSLLTPALTPETTREVLADLGQIAAALSPTPVESR